MSSLHPKRAGGWIRVHNVIQWFLSISIVRDVRHSLRWTSWWLASESFPAWCEDCTWTAWLALAWKKSSILICKLSGILHFEIPQTQWLETDVLRLRCHSNRKIGKDCEHVNFKRKSFCWKRLALFDIELELVRSRIWRSHGNIVSQLHVSLYALGPLVTFSFKQSCTSSNG